MLAAVALGGDPAVVPTRIGSGARFRPAAQTTATPSYLCVSSRSHFRVHLELFAEGRALVVPSDIGRRSATCVAEVRTVAPGGIVQVGRAGLTVGDLFRVWGQRLAPNRLLAFVGAVRVYVAGHRVPGDVRTVELTPNAQIVLEVGPLIPPHSFFLFPKGS
ncbi:unannotated protein [freshwater metagenome]|uniref:Unannotated protein n=1 Tax=freshwater metagenome TaxID=449393 RepID=A0A6J6NEH9_9ZZZZ